MQIDSSSILVWHGNATFGLLDWIRGKGHRTGLCIIHLQPKLSVSNYVQYNHFGRMPKVSLGGIYKLTKLRHSNHFICSFLSLSLSLTKISTIPPLMTVTRTLVYLTRLFLLYAKSRCLSKSNIRLHFVFVVHSLISFSSCLHTSLFLTLFPILTRQRL